MNHPLLRVAAGTAVVAATLVAFHSDASAHSNTVTCVDQSTSTWRITNDYPLAESFTSPQGPAGTVAAGNGSYTDVIYAGDSLQIDAVWTDGFTESRTGYGDCTPEGGTTTTVAETTTTEASTTSSTTSTVSETTTTVPASSTTAPLDTTSTLPTSSTEPTTTAPTTSSSVATTSTTSVPPSTPSPTTSTPSTPPAPSSTTPDQPICTPVTADINGDGDTTDEGENSCYRLPATGNDVVWLIPAAVLMLLCGGVIVICGRRR